MLRPIDGQTGAAGICSWERECVCVCLLVCLFVRSFVRSFVFLFVCLLCFMVLCLVASVCLFVYVFCLFCFVVCWFVLFVCLCCFRRVGAQDLRQWLDLRMEALRRLLVCSDAFSFLLRSKDPPEEIMWKLTIAIKPTNNNTINDKQTNNMSKDPPEWERASWADLGTCADSRGSRWPFSEGWSHAPRWCFAALVWVGTIACLWPLPVPCVQRACKEQRVSDMSFRTVGLCLSRAHYLHVSRTVASVVFAAVATTRGGCPVRRASYSDNLMIITIIWLLMILLIMTQLKTITITIAYMCVYIYIYIQRERGDNDVYVYICCVYIYIYIYIYMYSGEDPGKTGAMSVKQFQDCLLEINPQLGRIYIYIYIYIHNMMLLCYMRAY